MPDFRTKINTRNKKTLQENTSGNHKSCDCGNQKSCDCVVKDYCPINCDSLSESISFHATITYETCNVKSCKNDTHQSTEYWQLKQK